MRVNSFALVEDTVVLPDVTIARYCRIRRAVIDRFCEIKEGTIIGYDPEADRAAGFHVSEGGITLVSPEMLSQNINQVR